LGAPVAGFAPAVEVAAVAAVEAARSSALELGGGDTARSAMIVNSNVKAATNTNDAPSIAPTYKSVRFIIEFDWPESIIAFPVLPSPT
jgi:hypothetical protein